MSADLRLPHQLAGRDKTLRAACHCRRVEFTITVPTSALPLPVHLCHCSICRHTHGTLSCFHAPLPKGVQPEFVPPSSLASSLTGYVHAQAVAERLFCTTCGCHVGDRSLEPEPDTGLSSWVVATSIFAAHDEETFQIRSHCYSTPATEPNLATWLPAINGRPIHLWNPSAEDVGDSTPRGEGRKQAAPAITTTATAAHDDDDDDDGSGGGGSEDHADQALQAQCHCGGVSFAVLPPTEQEAADPFLSQFLQPEPSPDAGAAAASEAESASALRLKRPAGLCLCRDCRLVTGAHVVAWMYAPLGWLRPRGAAMHGEVEERRQQRQQQQQQKEQREEDEDEDEEKGEDDKFGLCKFGTTLRTYRSSPPVTRAFCGVCGATVLYASDSPERIPPPPPDDHTGSGAGPQEEGLRRTVVDVAVGILRDPSGSVAADQWLLWQTARCEGTETGTEFDRGFAEGLERGLAEWGLKRYGTQVDFGSL
ncbi:hypothetical protein VTJ83DRAFT_5159 [Remersonia thermophila]|uniref:CENP-V/GFA domain-containing protein n=1 Tax=Remersonia thermophila TaxID=72144 RepID=A0ABR4DC82_9PEZI